jgi:hypothetical protein
MVVKWSVIFRKEQRLKVSEDRMLRRKFGPKKYEVTEGWRDLHNEKLLRRLPCCLTPNESLCVDWNIKTMTIRLKPLTKAG